MAGTIHVQMGPTPPPEDDRALARMLGCAFLFGLIVLGLLVWLGWDLWPSG